MATGAAATQQGLTPEVIMERVREALAADRAKGHYPWCGDADIERVAVQCVIALWDASCVKTFIPILALRRARVLLGREAGMHRSGGME